MSPTLHETNTDKKRFNLATTNAKQKPPYKASPGALAMSRAPTKPQSMALFSKAGAHKTSFTCCMKEHRTSDTNHCSP